MSVQERAETCERCGEVTDEGSCCSAHNNLLCHRCYRWTHYVEVCGCAACVRDRIPRIFPRFYVSESRRTVHLAGCKVRGRRTRWAWAEFRSDRQVALALLEHGRPKPCRRCCGELADAL